MAEDRRWWFNLFNKSSIQMIEYIEGMYLQHKIDDWQLWDVLSNEKTPVTPHSAEVIYRQLGFKPFAGYPLVKEVPGG